MTVSSSQPSGAAGQRSQRSQPSQPSGAAGQPNQRSERSVAAGQPSQPSQRSGAAGRQIGAGRPAVAGGGSGQRIGEVASKAGVTTRTLRYYQELGLLDPGHSPGGSRRYTDADAARLRRIIELRDVMGFDLERIREILDAEDRLAQLRAEAQRGTSDERRRDILAEAIAINAHMQGQVRSKRAVLDGFLAQLEAKAAHYATVSVELGLDRPGKTPVVTG